MDLFRSYRVKIVPNIWMICHEFLHSCTHTGARVHTHTNTVFNGFDFYLFLSLSHLISFWIVVSHCFVYSFVKRRRASLSTNRTKSHVYTIRAQTLRRTRRYEREKKRRTHTNTLKFNSPSPYYLLSYICRGQNPFACIAICLEWKKENTRKEK